MQPQSPARGCRERRGRSWIASGASGIDAGRAARLSRAIEDDGGVVRAHRVRLSAGACAAVSRRRPGGGSLQRRLPARGAAAGRRRRRADRALAAEHVDRRARPGHAVSDARARAARLRAGAPARAAHAARCTALGAARAAAGLPARARARAALRACRLLLVHGPVGLGRAHDRRRLPDPPRPELRAARFGQLLWPVHPGLLRRRLPLRRRHALRRQRAAARAAADLGLPAVLRADSRARLGPGVGDRAALRAARRLGRAGRLHGQRARDRLRLSS